LRCTSGADERCVQSRARVGSAPFRGAGQTAVDDKLQEIEQRFERLTADLGDPAVLSDPGRYRQTAKERAQLEPLVDTYRDFKRVRAEVEGNEALLADSDADVRQMARDELPALKAQL